MTAEDLMRRAIGLSRDSMHNRKGGPFGALVVKDGIVIATGMNQVTATNDPTAHAEVVAIRNACAALGDFNLRGCEIYTSCEPCPMCLAAIQWAHIDRIYYAASRTDAAQAGFDDEALYEQAALPHDQRATPLIPLLRTEAQEIFAEWTVKADKMPY